MKKNINRIKYTLNFLWVAGLFLLAGSCGKDSTIGQQPIDGVPPASPELISVENISGAATIFYKIPKDEDLLYVCAQYKVGNYEHITKASVYENKLKVEGFGKKGDYPVFLYSVDRSRNESPRVNVTVSPDTTPVELIYKSLDIIPSFGGLRITWTNTTEANIIISVMAADSLGDLTNVENFYSSTQEGLATLRGYDTIPREFGVYVRDRWDNYSETKTGTFTPMFEKQLDKNNFKVVTRLPGDWSGQGGFTVDKIWDGETVGTNDQGFFHGKPNDIGKCITFDMGVVAKLSRFRSWQRTNANSFIYSHNNLKHYIVYGCTEITAEMRETGSLDGWTKVMDTWCFKPSGMDNPVVTNEDKEYIRNGDEHEIPLDIPPVRYIRILMLENWSGGTIPQIAEMTFWGQEIK